MGYDGLVFVRNETSKKVEKKGAPPDWALRVRWREEEAAPVGELVVIILRVLVSPERTNEKKKTQEIK